MISKLEWWHQKDHSHSLYRRTRRRFEGLEQPQCAGDEREGLTRCCCRRPSKKQVFICSIEPMTPAQGGKRGIHLVTRSILGVEVRTQLLPSSPTSHTPRQALGYPLSCTSYTQVSLSNLALHSPLRSSEVNFF